MAQKFKNNARTTLGGSGLANTLVAGDTFTVTAAAGALFPAGGAGDYFDVTIQDSTQIEIIRISSRTSDTFTIQERQREGTSLGNFASGAIIACRLTAGAIEEVLAHVSDTSDAHAASAISILDTAGDFTATDVEGALAELQAEKEATGTAAAAVAAHTGDAIDAHDASAISYDPTGTALAATDVQAALNELDADLTAHIDDASAAHAASAINIVDAAGDFTATDVEGALAELQSEKASTASIASTKRAFTAQQTAMSGALTDGASIAWDGDSNGQVVSVTLGGNRSMAAPTNIVQNTMYLIRIAQDATGSRTLTWDAAYKFGTAGAPTLTTTASKVDFISFVGGAGNTLECLGVRLNAV